MRTYRQHIWVMVTVTVVMAVMGALVWQTCRQISIAANHARYAGMTALVAEKIGNTIKSMEMSAMNVFDEVEKNMDSPESVIAALQRKTSLNPEVRGYFAAFEPNYFAEKGQWFEPYVHHVDDGDFKLRLVGSARHNYHKSDWYVRAKRGHKSFWSAPYYYYDGTNISGHYTTFVKPVYDDDGRLACVCGADMTLEWLSKELQQIDASIRQNSLQNKFRRFFMELDFYSVVINKDGSCIAYPEGKSTPIKDEAVLRDLAEEQSGTVEVVVNGEPATAYYNPIQYVDWSVAVVVPHQATWMPVYLVGLILLSVALIGIVIVWLVLRRLKHEEAS